MFRRLSLAGLALGALGAPAGWIASDRLEQDNDFCNACHLERGPDGVVPLHREIREDFDRREPLSLAAAHGAAAVEARAGRGEDGAFRCIDCHGGTSFRGRVRVKLLAAKDALVYATGRFEEPTGMRWPLWDEDCAKCHERFAPPAEGAGTPAFHDVAAHNAALPVGCVDCHFAHETGGRADAYFLQAAAVRRECARCHAELEP
jgi:hypothetical protein